MTDVILPADARAAIKAQAIPARQELAAEIKTETAFEKPKPFAGLRSWFKDAVGTAQSFGKAVQGTAQHLTGDVLNTTGRRVAAGVAGLALAGTLGSPLINQDTPTAPVAKSPAPVSVMAENRVAPAVAPTAISPAAAIAEPVAPVAVAAATAPAPVEMTRSFTHKARHSDPLPAVQARESLTVAFKDGSSIESKQDAGVWSRMCQKGFDICKKLTNG